MRNLTLRQIRIFLSAAKHLSFSHAAEELHITGSAVSLQIKEMEGDIGISLFNRDSKKIALTTAGEHFLTYANRMMSTFNDASAAMDNLRGSEMGILKIGLVSTTRYFLPKILLQFKKDYPNLQIKVVVKNRQALIELLTEGSIDIAIMGKPPANIHAQADPFANHPHGFIASPAHRLAGQSKLPADILNQVDIISREEGSGTRYIMEKYIAEQGLSLKMSMEMSGNETIKQAVMADLGVSFVSLHTVGNEIASKQVVLLDIKGTPVMRTWHIVTPNNHPITQSTEAFRQFILEKAEAILNDLFGMQQSS
jgi:LysR family transcriptional regulator, low CO2-responsive transcriptional regulator